MSATKQRSVRQSVSILMLAAIGGAGVNVTHADTDVGAEVAPRFDAIGDSITWGDPIRFFVRADGTVVPTDVEYQGWPELLGATLASEFDARRLVRNLGEPGAEVTTLADNHPRIWFKSEEQPDVLLLIGTNDSNPWIATPSGHRCAGGLCEGTYVEELKLLVRNLLSQGRETVYVASLPPIWGNSNNEIFADPLSRDATRNQLVIEYNRVVSEEILSSPGVRAGPDLFSCFLTPDANRFSLFRDILHPNTLGQVVIAAVWHSSLAGEQGDTCFIPIYIVASLDSYRFGHKQNLLAEGDKYFVDEEYVLLNVPDELAAGIWITPANAHKAVSVADYLVFDAGDDPVSVYIAFDPSGEPPPSATHQFEPVTLSGTLDVSDAAVGTYEVVVSREVVGQVQIAGPGASRNGSKQQSYLVIVVP